MLAPYMIYDRDNPDIWYPAELIPNIQDAWNNPEISDHFLDALLHDKHVFVANNLTGALCAILTGIGVQFKVWYPKYECVMGDYMPVANFNKITI